MSVNMYDQSAFPGVEPSSLLQFQLSKEEDHEKTACPNCGAYFTTRKACDRKRHWTPYVKCPKKECTKTFRTDKSNLFLKHLDGDHDDLDKAECKLYFEVMKEALKSITITNMCNRKAPDWSTYSLEDPNIRHVSTSISDEDVGRANLGDYHMYYADRPRWRNNQGDGPSVSTSDRPIESETALMHPHLDPGWAELVDFDGGC